MGSHLNFKNFRNNPSEGSGGSGSGSGGGRPLGNFLLAPQSSINSWTPDKFPRAIGGTGKDFRSISLKKEIQSMGSARGTTQAVGHSVGYSQRQGSSTLPRTLPCKTVDEVWRDILKESTVGEKDSSGAGHTSMPQRQTNLGDMTLEEFLIRACVIREDVEFPGKPNTARTFGGSFRTWKNTAVDASPQEEIERVGSIWAGNVQRRAGKRQRRKIGIRESAKRSRAHKQVPNSPPVSEASVNQPRPEHSSSSSSSSASISQFCKLLRKVTYNGDFISVNEQELSANPRNEGEIQSGPRNDLSSDQTDVDLQLGLYLNASHHNCEGNNGITEGLLQ